MRGATYHRRARQGIRYYLVFDTCSNYFIYQNPYSMRKSICKLDESDLHRIKRDQNLIVGRNLYWLK